ncbi:MAG: aspartate kinase [candidate division KSB1 bacterium]|nr:aspartate kinase [candidate division KSB1 bacterium]
MTEKHPLIVQKYGGSSLATSDHVMRVARHIVERKKAGCDLVVVASAMGKTTDNLIKLAHEMNPNPDLREMDMLLSVGEQISISALSLAVQYLGYKAKSFTGSQIGIYTDARHSRGRIQSINPEKIKTALSDDYIVIVAGFQGCTQEGEITTLGRGGSDTTAVALAAVLDAEYCEIMSDIDGIYNADPKKVMAARRMDRIDYDQALEMASAGAKMLHKHSVEFAKEHGIKLSLGSSRSGRIGTIVSDTGLAQGSITGVVSDDDIALIRFALNRNDALELPAFFSKERILLKLWQSVQGLGMIGVSRGDTNLVVRAIQEKTTNVGVEENWALLSLVGIRNWRRIPKRGTVF